MPSIWQNFSRRRPTRKGVNRTTESTCVDLRPEPGKLAASFTPHFVAIDQVPQKLGNVVEGQAVVRIVGARGTQPIASTQADRYVRRRLKHPDSACAIDRAQSIRAVGTISGKDHADHAWPVDAGGRLEKAV